MPLSSGEKRRLINQARDYIRSKDYQDAIRIYRQILESGQEPEVYQQLGDVYERINDRDNSIEAFRHSANLYMDEEMWREALGVYRRLSRIMKEDSADLGWDLANLYLKMNMEVEAIRELTNFGDKKMNENDLQEAFKAFDKVMELEPENVFIRIKYADLLEQKGQFNKAMDNYQIVKNAFEKKGDQTKIEEFQARIDILKSKIKEITPQVKTKETKKGKPDFGFMLGEFVEETGQKETASASEDNYVEQKTAPPESITPEPPPESEQTSSYVEVDLKTEELKELPALNKLGTEGDEEILESKEEPTPEISAEQAEPEVSEPVDQVPQQDEFPLGEIIDEVAEEMAEATPGAKPEKVSPKAEESTGFFEGLDLQDLLSGVSEQKSEESEQPDFSITEDKKKQVDKKIKSRKSHTVSMSNIDETISLEGLLKGDVDSWSDVASELAKELLDDKGVDEFKATQDKILTESTTWEEFEEQAQLLLSVGETEEAIDYLYQAADGYYDENVLDKSWQLYNQIVDLRPFEIRPRQKMVQIALKLEDTEKATTAYLSLYDCQKRRGAFIDAEETLGKLRNIAPNHPGVIARDHPHTEKTTPEGQAVDLSTLLEMETLQEKIGNRSMNSLVDEFKEEVYQSISSSERENYDAHYDLGITFKEMGLYDEAIEEFTIATKSKKSFLKSMEMIANCLFDLGKKDAAVSQLEEVINNHDYQESELVGIRYLLGTIYESRGNSSEAKNQYIKVYQSYPDFADIKEKVKKFK
ncbi:MAG: hypothetical protein APR63_04645 [Desulfuromonas sp. SDB]|nr:MAG: hypothetical protein APR63_04645 [Desulfuromonas sp. SDB]